MADIKLTLDLAAAQLGEVETMTQPLVTAGYWFFTLAQTGDTALTRRRLYNLVQEGVCGTPGFTCEFESYSAFVERIYNRSYWQHADSQFLAAYGDTWVGLSSLVLNPDGNGFFGLTAVTKTHRAKGIARTLKLLALHYARAKGVSRVMTENHPENIAMLRLNKALGFTETVSRVSHLQ